MMGSLPGLVRSKVFWGCSRGRGGRGGTQGKGDPEGANGRGWGEEWCCFPEWSVWESGILVLVAIEGMDKLIPSLSGEGMCMLGR